MKSRLLAAWVTWGLAACGTSPAATPDAATDSSEISADATTSVDVSSDATTATGPTWRDALHVCWTDLNCKRAFVISHGGDWSIDDFPYDSEGAFHRAADKGADGIKTDVHVTKDNVAVVTHSSPLLGYETTDCAGLVVQDSTADQVTKCHIFPSDTQTFQRLDTVLEWARGKVIIMLTVKEPVDFPRAIQTVIEHNALDYVFLETGLGDLQNAVQKSPDWQKTWYNAQASSEADVDAVVQSNAKPRVAFLEVNVDWQEAANPQMADVLAKKIHPAGLRGFVSSIHLPAVADHVALWDVGFDVIMTYNLDNALAARKQVNAARGIEPN